MEKINMQAFADSLGLSRVTVWKVLNHRPGVSPKTAQRVQDALETFRGTQGSQGQGAPPPRPMSLTLVASRADTSVFWTRIVDQIASELHLHGITLNYIPIDVMKASLSELKAMLSPDRTSGLLVINVYSSDVLTLLRETHLPAVYLDTIPGCTAGSLGGDLLLLEGERTAEALTTHLIERGCTRIGFIGDVHYALTNLLRWNGFEKALRSHGLPVCEDLCLTAPIGPDTYPEEIQSFLKGLSRLPDAFVCVNDYVAFLACNLLPGPDAPMLTGYDDSREFLLEHRRVPTAQVQNGLLGKRMVHQLLFRIENPQADYEEILIYPKILYRE